MTNLRDSKLSDTKRRVNASYIFCLITEGKACQQMAASAYCAIGNANLWHFFECQRTNMRFFSWGDVYFSQSIIFSCNTPCLHWRPFSYYQCSSVPMSSTREICSKIERFCQARWAEPISIELCHGEKNVCRRRTFLLSQMGRAMLAQNNSEKWDKSWWCVRHKCGIGQLRTLLWKSAGIIAGLFLQTKKVL